MNYRLVATEVRNSDTGTPYPHIVWMGEFNSFESEEAEAYELAQSTVAPHCIIFTEEIPTIFH